MPTFLQTHISIPLTKQDRLSRGALKLGVPEFCHFEVLSTYKFLCMHKLKGKRIKGTEATFCFKY